MTFRMGVVIMLVLATGCARADWIESTLVTVDVTGEWAGEWVQPQFNGTLRLVLKQEGSRVTGDMVSFTGTLDQKYTGRYEGTVSGDVVVLRQTAGIMRLELTVNGDDMSGMGTLRAGNPTIKLRRSR